MVWWRVFVVNVFWCIVLCVRVVWYKVLSWLKDLFGVKASGLQIVLGCFGGKYKYTKYNNRQRVHNTGSYPSSWCIFCFHNSPSFGRSRGQSCVFFRCWGIVPRFLSHPHLSSPIILGFAYITLRTTKMKILMQPLRTRLMSLHCALFAGCQSNTCWTNKLINGSMNQPTTWFINESMNQSIHQSFNGEWNETTWDGMESKRIIEENRTRWNQLL